MHQWDDIGKLFQQDGSEEMCEKIFQCMYGWFKKQDAYARATKQFNQLWARLIEAKFMEDYGLRYQSEEIVHTGKKRKPNGIESLISREYNELNKLINNRTKVTHRKKNQHTTYKIQYETNSRYVLSSLCDSLDRESL